MQQKLRRTPLAVGAALVALSMAATACGSSAPSSSGSESKADIVVMATGMFESTAFSFPDAEPAMQAKVAVINAAGGIKGHKIKLIVCDDKLDANTSVGCARKAVSDKVVAVISHYLPYGPQVMPILEAAKIPLVYGPFGSDIDGQSPMAFPRDVGIIGYAAVGIELATAGCKKVGAIVQANANVVAGMKWLKDGLSTKGAGFVQVPVSDTQPDYSAPVSKLLSQGADCIVPAVSGAQAAKVVLALKQSGKTARLGTISSVFSSTQLAALGSSAEGMILTGQEFRPTDAEVPAIKQIVADLKTYEPNATLATKFGIAGWASVEVLGQLLNTINGEITSDSVLKALADFTPHSGLYADPSFGATAPLAEFPRLKNLSYLTWTVKDGKAVVDSEQFKTMSGL